MVSDVAFEGLSNRVESLFQSQEDGRRRRVELARSVEELGRSFNELKEAIEGITGRLPTTITPLCLVQTGEPSNTTGGETLTPDLIGSGNPEMKGVTIVSELQTHDEISKIELVERKPVSNMTACQLLDEMLELKTDLKASKEVSFDPGGQPNGVLFEHFEEIDIDEYVHVEKADVINYGDVVRHDKELVQIKVHDELEVQNETQSLVAQQVFDEMSKQKICLGPELCVEMVLNETLKPQHQLEQVELRALEVGNGSYAKGCIVVPTDDRFMHALDTNGLFVHSVKLSFDPGGRHDIMWRVILDKGFLQPNTHYMFNEKPKTQGGQELEELNVSTNILPWEVNSAYDQYFTHLLKGVGADSCHSVRAPVVVGDYLSAKDELKMFGGTKKFLRRSFLPSNEMRNEIGLLIVLEMRDIVADGDGGNMHVEIAGSGKYIRLSKLLSGVNFIEQCKDKNLLKRFTVVICLFGSITCVEISCFDPEGEPLSTNGNSLHLNSDFQRKISLWNAEKNGVMKFKEYQYYDVLNFDISMLISAERGDFAAHGSTRIVDSATIRCMVDNCLVTTACARTSQLKFYLTEALGWFLLPLDNVQPLIDANDSVDIAVFDPGGTKLLSSNHSRGLSYAGEFNGWLKNYSVLEEAERSLGQSTLIWLMIRYGSCIPIEMFQGFATVVALIYDENGKQQLLVESPYCYPQAAGFQLRSHEYLFDEMDYILAYLLLNLYNYGADLIHLLSKEKLCFYMGYYGERGKVCCYTGFYELVLISPTRILLLGFHVASLNWVNRYCLLYISNSGKEDLRVSNSGKENLGVKEIRGAYLLSTSTARLHC